MTEIIREVLSDEGLTVLRVTGRISFDHIIDELTRFYKEELTNNMIWNFSKAEGTDLSGNDMQNIISHTKEFGHLRDNGKTAFVISSSLGYGLGRMYDSLAQIAEHPIKHGVFRSYEEAVEWINSTETD